MGLQLIFVVETNRKCKSDWMYIKDTVERFYTYNKAHVKLSSVYMDGKGKYKNKVKEVDALIKMYHSASGNNESRVIYCFDCDEYDSNAEDEKFLQETEQFCRERGYEHVWFCKDIEEVYLGRRIPDTYKKKEAEAFIRKKMINQVDAAKMSAEIYRPGRSNILAVLDKISPELTRKSLD